MTSILKGLASAAALAVLALGAATAPASAGTASTTFQVTLSVSAACTVDATSGNVNFGNYNGAAVTANGQINVNCTQGAPYTISLDNGLNPASVGSGRSSQPGNPQMSGGTNNGAAASGAGALIAYQIFQDSALSTAWNGVGGAPLSSVGTGASQSFVTYGQIPAGEPYFVGAYVDTITASVNF